MSDEIKKPSFLVYYDNEIIVLRFPDEEAGKLFKSLFPYGRKKIKPDFDKTPALAMAFDILSMAIDRDKERYVRRCEANRENGRKGGRPKKNQMDIEVTEKSERLFSKPKKADKDRDKDIEKGMDMYMDRDKEKDIEDFQKLFTMAEESSFLKGQNNRNWSANFDWLIQDSNMAKVSDGNYVDRKEIIKGG